MTEWTKESELEATDSASEHGTGDEAAYGDVELPDFDAEQFEADLSDDDADEQRYGLIGNQTAVKFADLPNHLRRWGLNVVEVVSNWKTNGRPYEFEPEAVVCHHTASNRKSGNFGSKSIVINGRSDLPGPLAQILLGRNGDVIVVTGGRANHAGSGGPAGHMRAGDGNTQSFGIEAENDGIGEPWPAAQLNAYYRLCAALLNIMGRTDVSRVIGHKEWTRQKIDPAGINMDAFRKNVAAALAAGPVKKKPTVSLSKLQPGKRNKDVLLVKKALDKKKLFHGVFNNYYGAGLRKAYSAWQKHLGYTGSDADGIPGKASLEKLGFKVTK